MPQAIRLAAAPLLMLIGLAAAFLAARWLGWDAREAVASAGRQGPAAFIGIATLACAIGVPRQLVALAGGFAFGLWPGTALALLAEVAGCLIDFAWARLLARGAARRFLDRRRGGRLARLDRFLVRQAFGATLTLRLLPVGNNLALNLLAGVSGVAAAPFLLASAIGYVPQTVIFALAGSGASISDGARFALAAALLVISVLLGLVLLRRAQVAEAAEPGLESA